MQTDELAKRLERYANPQDLKVGPLMVKHALTEAAAEIRRLQALVEEARAGFNAILDGSVNRPLGMIYRRDKSPSRHDLCIHRVPMHGECGSCIDLHVSATLARLDASPPPVGE